MYQSKKNIMTFKNIFKLFTVIVSTTCFSQNLILNGSPSITNKVIFLDFDGHVAVGTLWNSGNAVNALPSTVSNANKILIWKRICEDYRPFDVNVTTDSSRFNNAPANQRIRIVFTPTSAWFGSAGGVAYLGSFNWGGNPGTPCWVFENQLGYNSKSMAEAASHEAGHTFTLRHQSTYNNLCVKTAEYNPGIGSGITGWAPIMGVGYSKNITVWTTGKSSVSCTTIQYDHGGISPGITSPGYLNYLTDDVGGVSATAKILNLNTTTLLDSGIITTPTDVDAFKFTICGNRYVSFNVKPWALDTVNYDGANLDIRFSLYNSSNVLLATDTSLTRLRTLVGYNFTPGTYYFTIDGGRSSNYTDYGSLGKYFISIKSNNPPAMANTILTNSAICSGQSATLNYTSNGTPTNWQWTVSGSTITSSILQNPIVQFNSAGVYTISLLASNANSASCISIQTINVGSLPSISIIGTNNIICPFESATLTANGSNIYNWMPGNYSGFTQIVSPSVTTNYTVTASNGSCSNSIVTTVSVSPNFTINVATTSSLLCPGQSLTLTASGANSYTINPGGVVSNSIILFPQITSTYVVTGDVGFCSKTTEKVINVKPDFTVNLIASQTTICAGEPISLMASGANTYTYYPGGLTNNIIVVNPTVSTTYLVYGTLNQCSNSNQIDITVQNCTSIEKNNDFLHDFKLFPNPANNFITIDLGNKTGTIEIINSMGSIIFQEDLNGINLLNINLNNWTKGIYFVKYSNKNNNLKVKKFIIQ